MLLKFIAVVVLIGGSWLSFAGTVELKSTEAQILADNLKRDISNTLAEINRLERIENPELDTLSIVLSQQAFNVISFGIVVDPEVNTVLSVTSHSNAEVLGLKVGDQIKALRINDEEIADLASGITLSPGAVIQAEVKREGSRNLLLLESIAKNKSIPAWNLQVTSGAISQNEVELTGCGYISVFFSPPSTKYQYTAKVFEVDGESGFHLRETIKVPAGLHTIKVHEYIPEHILARRKTGIEKAKTLQLIVEPDKTYHIAAQFEPEKRLNLVDESYWEPVVWKVSESKCRP